MSARLTSLRPSTERARRRARRLGEAGHAQARSAELGGSSLILILMADSDPDG
ncbi:MAG TPA: hypothetical protein VIV60_21560 [Polyangiaceae bacterium]